MRRLLAGLVIGLSAAAVGLVTPVAAQKTSNPGVSVTFADRAGDAIGSDGHGSYVNGVGGVVGQIFVTGSGDMTLNLSKTRPNRVFNGTYVPASDVPQPTKMPPSGTFKDGSFINIHAVWQIPVGATISTDASFTTGIGDFRWCGDGSGPAWCALTGSQQVSVTRTAFDTWSVEANSPGTTPGNDLDVLAQSAGRYWVAVGYYHMPFQLTIQCSNSLCQ
jgi:hypothetical protein